MSSSISNVSSKISSNLSSNVSSSSSLSSSILESLINQAIKVVSEMLIDREYKIELFDNSLDNYCIKGIKPNNIILVFINDDDKLNIQGIKDKITFMNKEGANKCVIIYKSNVTSSAKKSLETLEYEFELFSLKELQLNITRHRLVPRHTRILQSEKQELDKKYKGKLPIILHTDPICRYYAFQKGEYIRITRKDGTIIYRVVK
jgi:DNA-directed RNA polymerase subunit H (RpoH/RPB5)